MISIANEIVVMGAPLAVMETAVHSAQISFLFHRRNSSLLTYNVLQRETVLVHYYFPAFLPAA